MVNSTNFGPLYGGFAKVALFDQPLCVIRQRQLYDAQYG